MLALVSRLDTALLTRMLTDEMGGSLKFSHRPWTAHVSSQPQKDAEASVPLFLSNCYGRFCLSGSSDPLDIWTPSSSVVRTLVLRCPLPAPSTSCGGCCFSQIADKNLSASPFARVL